MCAAERAVVPVRETATAAMASGIAAASAALRQRVSEQPRASDLFQRMAAKMTQRLEEAGQTEHGRTWARDDGDKDEDEALAQLKASADISMDAVLSMTGALRQIAREVWAAAAQALQNPRLEHVSAAATRMQSAAAKIETGDWEAVRTWLKDEPLAKELPRGFLARELLRDLVKQLSRKLEFQIPKVLGDQQAKDLLADALLHAQTTSKLSKDDVAQMSAVASAAAQEAEKDMEESSRAAAAVGLQVLLMFTRVKQHTEGGCRRGAYTGLRCAVIRLRPRLRLMTYCRRAPTHVMSQLQIEKLCDSWQKTADTLECAAKEHQAEAHSYGGAAANPLVAKSGSCWPFF